MISTLALGYRARLWNSSYPHPVEWILYLVSVGAQGCHLKLFSAPQWKVSCKWSLLSLSLELQSLSHCGWETVWESRIRKAELLQLVADNMRSGILWPYCQKEAHDLPWAALKCYNSMKQRRLLEGLLQASLLLNAQPWHGLPFNLNY